MTDNLRLFARQLANTALDFFFPPKCIACRRAGSLFCSECQAKFKPPRPIQRPPLAEQRATAHFDGAIRDAIHALKYNNQRRYADPLGERLSAVLNASGWMPTMITATPLHEARLCARGYNQSALLAERVAQGIKIPFYPEAIARIRDTRAQVDLNGRDRQANVAGAFCAVKRLVEGQKIVIVDDVYTTGATLGECARALLDGGAVCVWGLTVASAGGE